MNLGVETASGVRQVLIKLVQFQHSLMNLGVETWIQDVVLPAIKRLVSAFSDESWGGDPIAAANTFFTASSFSIL